MKQLASASVAGLLGRSRGARSDVGPSRRESPQPYTVKLATNAQEFRAAMRLRYEVFNVELSEGLQSSHSTGYDFDAFDAVVDHIIVKCAYSGRVVGTYRLQTGITAARNIGYYSEQEFDFKPHETLRRQVLELGRHRVQLAYVTGSGRRRGRLFQAEEVSRCSRAADKTAIEVSMRCDCSLGCRERRGEGPEIVARLSHCRRADLRAACPGRTVRNN